MYRRALALVAVVAAAAAGDAPAGPYDDPNHPICGTAASPCKPCNRTFRIGAPRLAAPAALGIMGKSLDFLDACFAFYNGPSIDIDGDTPAAKMTTPDQEPAQDPAIVNYIPGAVQSSQSTDCNKAGGETVTTNPDCSDAIIQDAQETGGTGGETARK